MMRTRGAMPQPADFIDAHDAPHDPLPIHWTRGLAAGASLRDPEASTVSQAYAAFLRRFDGLLADGDGGRR